MKRLLPLALFLFACGEPATSPPGGLPTPAPIHARPSAAEPSLTRLAAADRPWAPGCPLTVATLGHNITLTLGDNCPDTSEVLLYFEGDTIHYGGIGWHGTTPQAFPLPPGTDHIRIHEPGHATLYLLDVP